MDRDSYDYESQFLSFKECAGLGDGLVLWSSARVARCAVPVDVIP